MNREAVCWEAFVRAVKGSGKLAGKLFWPCLMRPPAASGERLISVAAAASFVLVVVFPLMVPAQSPSQSEFERLRSTVEYHDKRIDSLDGRLSAAQTDITSIRLALQKVDTMDSLLKLIAGLFFPLAGSAVLFAYKAGRWVAKADGHISGEQTPIK